MDSTLQFTGGAKVGWTKISYPFAKLFVAPSFINLHVGFITFKEDYLFSPDDIISLEKFVVIPYVAWGIKINHTISDYPEKVIFWSFKNPDDLLKQITSFGFQAKANPSTFVKRVGSPIHGFVLLTIVMLGYAAFTKDAKPAHETIGLFSSIYIISLFAFVFLADKINFIKSLIVKPNRNLNELGPLLKAMQIGLGLVSLAIIFLYWTQIINFIKHLQQ